MLRFLSVIRHKFPCYTHTFPKKTQHLQRWISLRTFTQGRLVPRQPWAIKRTTPTALHCHNIQHGGYIHWNISTTPTALHGCNLRNDSWIHWNIGKKQTSLCTKNLHIAQYIHWKTIFIPMALTIDIIYIGVYHATYYWCNTYALRNNQQLIILCFQGDDKPHK